MSCRPYPIDRTDRTDKTPVPQMSAALRPDLTRVASDSEGGADMSGPVELRRHKSGLGNGERFILTSP